MRSLFSVIKLVVAFGFVRMLHTITTTLSSDNSILIERSNLNNSSANDINNTSKTSASTALFSARASSLRNMIGMTATTIVMSNETTFYSPSNATIVATTTTASPPPAPYPTLKPTLPCKTWCRVSNSTWEEKCGWITSCAACSECDSVTPTTPQPTTAAVTTSPTTTTASSSPVAPPLRTLPSSPSPSPPPPPPPPSPTHVEPRRYMFLHDSIEQYNAGKRTITDFAYIAILSGYIPVMPFLSESTTAFVGHINDPRSSSSLTTETEISVGKIPTLFEDYKTAMAFCKKKPKVEGHDKIALLHFDRSPASSRNNKNGTITSSGLCPKSNTLEYKKLMESKELWSVDSHSCMDINKVDITTLSNSPTNCIVLENFMGVWANRGKILMNTSSSSPSSSSSSAISLQQQQQKRKKLWDDTKTIMDRYYVSWMDSNGQSLFTPSSSHLVKAAHCLNKWSTMDNTVINSSSVNNYNNEKKINKKDNNDNKKSNNSSSNNNNNNPIYNYHILQLRLESIEISLRKFTNFTVSEKLIATEACVNKSIDHLILDIQKQQQQQYHHDDDDDNNNDNGILNSPIVLMGDFGKHGTQTGHSQRDSIPSTNRIRNLLEEKFLQKYNFEQHLDKKDSNNDNKKRPDDDDVVASEEKKNIIIIHTTDECNNNDELCIGPTCFFLDQAIFLLANKAVQLPGGGNSATQLAGTRQHAKKQTLRILPKYTSFDKKNFYPNNDLCPLDL